MHIRIVKVGEKYVIEKKGFLGKAYLNTVGPLQWYNGSYYKECKFSSMPEAKARWAVYKENPQLASKPSSMLAAVTGHIQTLLHLNETTIKR